MGRRVERIGVFVAVALLVATLAAGPAWAGDPAGPSQRPEATEDPGASPATSPAESSEASAAPIPDPEADATPSTEPGPASSPGPLPDDTTPAPSAETPAADGPTPPVTEPPTPSAAVSPGPPAAVAPDTGAYPDTLHLMATPSIPGVDRLGRTFSLQAVGMSGTSGSMLAGVRCRMDAGPWRECGPSTPTLYEDAPEGLHLLTAAAYDDAGLEDPTPLEWWVTIDWTAPVGSVAINGGAPTVGRLTWHVDMPALDDDGVARITVTATPPDEHGQLQGGLEYERTAWENVGWTVRYLVLGGSPEPGTKTLWVQWSDALGNRSEAVSVSVEYDPGLEPASTWRVRVVENPVPVGKPVFLHALLLAADGVRVDDGPVTVDIDGHPFGAWTASASQASTAGISVRFQPPAPGSYTARFAFGGGAGVGASQTAFTFQVGPGLDLRPPDTVMDGLPPDPATPNVVTRTLAGQRAASFECAVDDGPWAPCSSPWSPELADGLRVLAVRAVSAAGVVDPTPDRNVVFMGATRAPGSVYPVDGRRRVLDPVVSLVTWGPEGVDTMRMSGSAATGPGGRLTLGLDTPVGGNSFANVPWDLTDMALGGRPGDGAKEVIVQWRRLDGTWTAAVGVSITLLQSPPPLRMVVDNGAGYLDDSSRLHVLLETTLADGWFTVVADPLRNVAGPVPVDGVSAFVVPIEPVPIGTVAVRTVTGYLRTYELDAVPVTVSVVIDRSSPTASVSMPVVVTGARAGPEAVGLRLKGSSADTGIGVASTDLQTAVGSASFRVRGSAGGPTVAAVQSVAEDRPLAIRVRGTDRLGHVGAWVSRPTVRVDLRGDGSSLIRYRGWTRASSATALGDRIHRTRTAGATAVIRFTGGGIALVSPMGPGMGRMAMTVDGRSAGTVDLRRSTWRSRVVVFARSWAVSGSHTVVLRALGTPGRPTVALDGFIILR